ncbi:MAG: calcium-binding protein, partial [Acidobacteriota bacterium]
MIEANLDPIHNHSIITLTDPLALYSIFAKIDPTLNTMDPTVGMAKVTNILKAASNISSGSLEANLDSLRKLFRTPNLTPTAIDNRDQYFQNITALVDLLTTNGVLKPEYQGLTVVELTSKDAFQIEALAFSDIGYRYALKELNPFAIVGNNTLYVPHNLGGELSLYVPVTGNGLTRDYLADRAGLLQAVLASNTNDTPNNALIAGASLSAQYHYYADGTDHILFADPAGRGFAGLQRKVVMFADDAGRILTGFDFAIGDHLFGGKGIDTLAGNSGDDYLEGNAGADTLQGGTGNDTLLGGAGNDRLEGGTGLDTYLVGAGHDTIIDADGRGVVKDATGRVLQGTFVKQGTQYVWVADPTIVATRNSPLTITLSDGASVTIDEFVDGNLGIVLADTEGADDASTNVVNGTDFNDDGTSQGGQTHPTLLGDSGGVATADEIHGFLGNDIIDGRDGEDRLFGDEGRDIVFGGLGDDTLQGGTDGDILLGVDGHDVIVSEGLVNDDFFATMQAAIDSDATPPGLINEFLGGGGGNDILVGGSGNDAL